MKRPDLAFLMRLANEAGEQLAAAFTQPNSIDLKGEVNLVTEADRRSETLLLGAISSAFPEHQVVSEETGGISGSDQQVWYVDPLDGTTNFAHGLPIFSVSIAYEEKGELTLGVVYNPVQGEMYAAEKGKGAWLNGDPIRVGERTRLRESLLITGFPYDRNENPDNNLKYFEKFLMKGRGVRRLGSAALDLCYIAAGRADGYWEIRLEAWDVAAGSLIAREAGAAVTKRDGGPDIIGEPISVVAANPALHARMLAVLGEEG